MCYLFNETFLSQFQTAFESCDLIKKPVLTGSRHLGHADESKAIARCTNACSDAAVTSHTFFIKFNDIITVADNANPHANIIDLISKGDAVLHDYYQECAKQYGFADINVNLHWQAAYIDKARCFLIKGIGFEFVTLNQGVKVIAPEHFDLYQLVKAGLLCKETVEGLGLKIADALRNAVSFTAPRNVCLFPPRQYAPDQETQQLLAQARGFISHNVTTINPAYAWANEKATNPVYQNIEHVTRPLARNENRIFILRSDFVLATGIKNAYKLWFGYTGLEDAFEPGQHAYIGTDDRYGHPSLTHKHPGYDGSSFYAGYVAKRIDEKGKPKLEALLFSGRYYRRDLSLEVIRVIEAYISLQFIEAYGEHTVEFVDISNYKDYFDLSLYLHNGSFPDDIYTKRVYNKETIAKILEEKTHSYDHAQEVKAS